MQHNSPLIRVFVIADDPLVRASLAASLGNEDEIEVIASLPVTDFESDAFNPSDADVILLDEGWLEGDPTDHRRELDTELPIVHLVDPGVLDHLTRIPSGSVISRESPSEDLVSALVAAISGWIVLDPLAAPDQRTDRSQSSLPPLTDREHEVLTLVSEGLTNKAIAAQLEISENTVKYHVNSILSKLGAQSRTEAVVTAARSGLLPL